MPPRTNGTTPAINWAAARAYWLALPATSRTFGAVAARFGVTPQRVGQIARRDGWHETLAARTKAQEDALERAELRVYRQIARNRAERLQRTLELYDRVTDLGLELLPLTDQGEIDVAELRSRKDLPSLADLIGRMPGLHRMAELAAGNATDRVELSSVQPVLVAFAKIALVHAPPERRGDVQRALEAAAAGMVELDT